MEVVKVLRTLKASFFLSILLILPICFSFSPSTAYAAESDAVAISGATQEFDLTKGPEQSHQIKLKDGTVAVIGIKKTNEPSLIWDSYYNNASGTWTIYYNSPFIYREFKIKIANSLITSAWGQNYTTIGCTVTNESFIWNSKQATYRLNYESMGMTSGIAVLQATMEGSTLHTYAN